MRRWLMFAPWLFAICGSILYMTMLPRAVQTQQRHEQLFTLPPQLLRVLTGQFSQVAADVSFLNALTYLGGISTQKDTHRYLPEQYEWVHRTLQNSVSLDPHFMDPYYLMNSALIWDRYKLNEVNALIASGADHRSNDAILAFFAGFNYYYFLNDAEKSVQYLKLASKRSGGNSFYDTLAARIAYKMNKTELGIAYLEQQIQMAELEGSLYSLEPLKKRLEVLQGIRKIELAVEAYHKLFARYPAQIDELIKLKMLDAIPKDDLGGEYYLDDQGRVRSTKDVK